MNPSLQRQTHICHSQVCRDVEKKVIWWDESSFAIFSTSRWVCGAHPENSTGLRVWPPRWGEGIRWLCYVTKWLWVITFIQRWNISEWFDEYETTWIICYGLRRTGDPAPCWTAPSTTIITTRNKSMSFGRMEFHPPSAAPETCRINAKTHFSPYWIKKMLLKRKFNHVSGL